MSSNVLQSSLPPREYPKLSVGQYFHDKIEASLQENPDHVALIDAAHNDRHILLKTIQNEALCLASSLVAYGLLVSPDEDRVLFFAHNRPEHLTSLLAFAYLGLPLCLTRPRDGPFETYQRLADLQPSVLVVTDGHQLETIEKIMAHPQWSQAIKSLKLLIIISDKALEPDHHLFRHPAAPKGIVTYNNLIILGENLPKLQRIPYFDISSLESTPAAIAYTSGTSGEPKGAVHCHRSLVTVFVSSGFEKGTVLAQIYPLGHISGFSVSLSLLSSLSTQIFWSGEGVPAKVIFESLDRLGVTLLPLMPEMVSILADADNYRFKTVKFMFVGGAKVSVAAKKAIEAKHGLPLINGYAATEMLVGIGNHRFPPPNDQTIGQLSADVQLRIVHRETGENLPAGQEGEMLLRGPSLFIGYWHKPEETEKTIDHEGWYHSGDLGKYDTDGNVYITDRIKEMIKYKGWSIAPAYIECLLRLHPMVLDACVVGVKHSSEVSHLRAFCQLKPEASVSTEEIREFARTNLGYPSWLTAGVVFVAHIPRTIIGKVDRAHFRRLVDHETITTPAPLQ